MRLLCSPLVPHSVLGRSYSEVAIQSLYLCVRVQYKLVITCELGRYTTSHSLLFNVAWYPSLLTPLFVACSTSTRCIAKWRHTVALIFQSKIIEFVPNDLLLPHSPSSHAVRVVWGGPLARKEDQNSSDSRWSTQHKSCLRRVSFWRLKDYPTISESHDLSTRVHSKMEEGRVCNSQRSLWCQQDFLRVL